MQAIYTNILSAMVQNTLSASQSQVATATEQLSTGIRLSNAEDPAGYAIAQRMTAQINGLSQAGMNVNDGISMLQVADGAISQMTDAFQKIRTLAVEAANPTYSTTDRQAMQNEVDQFIASNLQISRQTNYNGVNLLDGSFINQQLQIGANPAQTLLLSIPPVFAQSQGSEIVQAPLLQATASGQVVSAINAGALTIDGVAIGPSVAGSGPGEASGSAWAIANAINNANIGELTASASSATAANLNSGPIAAGALVINGVALNTAVSGATQSILAANAASAINGMAASTGVTAAASGTTLTLSNASGGTILISGTNTLGLASTRGTITLTTNISPDASNIVIAGHNPGNAGLSAGIFKSVPSGGTVPVAVALSGEVANVTTTANAGQTISYMDTQIANCNNMAAYLGASQNVLASIHANVSESAVNLSSAQARIQDTDYAAATAALVHSDILQSANVAMLAQANTEPRNVINLLIR